MIEVVDHRYFTVVSHRVRGTRARKLSGLDEPRIVHSLNNGGKDFGRDYGHAHKQRNQAGDSK